MRKLPAIDLNCDLGEGAGHDEELMPFVSSANIACGAHAGDADVMRATVRLARLHGVAIGAHPGFADRGHFGRRELALSSGQIVALVRAQVETLCKIARDEGVAVAHVKPHGALYNLAARDARVADAIAEAVAGIDMSLWLYGLAGGELLKAGKARGLRVAAEGFSDRTYQADGSLTPRNRPDALITNEPAAVAQVLRMVSEGKVRSNDGSDVPLAVQTVCVHGDGDRAVAFVRELRAALEEARLTVRSPG